MYRSQFTRSKPLTKSRLHSPTATPKSSTQDPAIYVSKVTIQLAGNTNDPSRKSSTLRATPSPRREESNNYFSASEKRPVEGTPRTSTQEPQVSMSPRARKQNISGVHNDNSLSRMDRPLPILRTPSPQRKASNSSFSASKKTNSMESFSNCMLSQAAKRPVEGTPRTSTPELLSPRDGKQKISDGYDILSSMERTRKYVSTDSRTTSNAYSSNEQSRDKISHPPLQNTTQYSHRNEFSTKKHWYYEILQRLEDLSWSYQTLETEYSFLERLMDEQKEDLKKAKSWSKHFKNQNPSNSRTHEIH